MLPWGPEPSQAGLGSWPCCLLPVTCQVPGVKGTGKLPAVQVTSPISGRLKVLTRRTRSGRGDSLPSSYVLLWLSVEMESLSPTPPEVGIGFQK